MEVRLIDVLGDDNRVANAARISFHKDASNYTEEQNAKLIKYLADHNHHTPFMHVQITMYEKIPIFVARQRFKHMVGFTYNEVSRRYVDDPPEFYTPDSWRKKADNKKQGSSNEEVDNTLGVNVGYAEIIDSCIAQYNWMLEQGVAPELARIILPQSMYTEVYVTGSLAAWARAFKLRSDPHAQKEIRDLADKWNEIISGLPQLKYSWSALVS